jgi:hypothetical protein
MCQGEEQLAAVLEADERIAGSGEGERIGADEATLLEHELAVPEVAGEIAIRVQHAVLQRQWNE